MFDLLLLLTGLVIAAGAVVAARSTRDALHPGVVLAAPLFYGYSLWPFLLNMGGELESLLTPASVAYVGALYLAAMIAVYAGLLRTTGRKTRAAIRNREQGAQSFFAASLGPATRRRLYVLGVVLGAASVLAYLHMIQNAGGFAIAYGQAKGGGWASSGYIGEAILLSFPSVLLLALACQPPEKLGLKEVLIAIVIVSPHLVQGTLGGRRGPLFLALTVLFFGQLVARGHPPRLKSIALGMTVAGLGVVLAQSQRQHLYLGSGGTFDATRIWQVVLPGENLETNDYVAGVANVLTADYHGDYYWGYRYFVTVFIRPIPRQLWPNKYADMDARWLHRWDADEGGADLLEAVGFRPPIGSSVGFVSDMYYEFAWGALVLVYLFGWSLGVLWQRHRLRGGLWTVLHIEAMILAIYIPTQSFSAWFHRFFLMAAITTVVWRYWIHRRSRPVRYRTPQAVAAPSSVAPHR